MMKYCILSSGHCDLDPDLVFRIFVSGAYLSYYLRKEYQIWCVHASWDVNCRLPTLGQCDRDLDL